jgi:hypothetical protein
MTIYDSHDMTGGASMVSKWLCTVALVCAPSAANAESLVEMWASPAKATLTSKRSVPALETCLGEVLTESGIPLVLHGEEYTTVSLYHAYSRKLALSVRIYDDGAERRALVNGSRSDDRETLERLRSCL